MKYKEIKIEPMFRNIERTDQRDIVTLTRYIAVDTTKKWYLHGGFFSSYFGISNYEDDNLICGFDKSGNIISIGKGKINIKNFTAIKKLYNSAVKLGIII
jgi:hypothetical protein